MKIAPSVAELQRENIVLELESIDRMYLNAYVPKLTSEKGIAGYFRGFLGHRFASTKSAAGKSEALVRAIMKFIARPDQPHPDTTARSLHPPRPKPSSTSHPANLP